ARSFVLGHGRVADGVDVGVGRSRVVGAVGIGGLVVDARHAGGVGQAATLCEAAGDVDRDHPAHAGAGAGGGQAAADAADHAAGVGATRAGGLEGGTRGSRIAQG